MAEAPVSFGSKVASGARGAQQAIGAVKPPSFTKGVGAVVSLLVLNVMWSVYRSTVSGTTTASQPTVLGGVTGSEIVKELSGIWIVGLGLLIGATFAPEIAVPFAVLFTIGNVMSSGKTNTAAISGLHRLTSGPGKITTSS